MSSSEWPRFNDLRFDSELKSFDKIMSLFISSTERAKMSGRKIIAKAPQCPTEPIYAAGALAYEPHTHEAARYLLTEEDFKLTSKAVDAGLSPDFNLWNLLTAGAVVSAKNEVAVDAYTNACGCFDDQLKNTWKLMAGAAGVPLFFWDIPRFDIESVDWSIGYLIRELEQLFSWLAVQTGNEVTEHSLAESIKLGNLLRQDLLEITQMLQLPNVPVSALEYYLAQSMIDDYAQDPEMLHNRFVVLLQELKERSSQSISAPGISDKPLRIFFMGEETPELRIWNALEDYGGVLVGCDTRLSMFYKTILESGAAIENLAQWIWRMPCNLPVADRIKATIEFIRQQKADAIIINSLVGSNTIPGTERYVQDIIKTELGLPVLYLETLQTIENSKQHEKQIKAFIEKNSG